ncbi:hypothetical protein AVEN_137867-1 [Araneus ventricosus]|uniref:Uncharacterized protein n=1 Tax=Araneus ventricosus TaxID=182803 RepID=A0A4Y2EGL2_ARAVE|nr:hypothetical protein AVEN_137867-1 [Araneus ventricosus]
MWCSVCGNFGNTIYHNRTSTRSEKKVNPSSEKTYLNPAEQEIKLWKCDVKENRLSKVPLLSDRNDQLTLLRKDHLDFLVEGRKGSSSFYFHS